MKSNAWLWLFLAVVFSGPIWAGESSTGPTVRELKERFAREYQCPGTVLKGFEATVSSSQTDAFFKTLGLECPVLPLRFFGTEGMSLTFQMPAGVPPAKQMVARDLLETLQNSAEGFFQTFEPVAWGNPLERAEASGTVIASGSGFLVEYPEGGGQKVTLLFDEGFRMQSLEARDEAKGVSGVLKVAWEKAGSVWVPVRLQNEYVASGVRTFSSEMTIQNGQIGSFTLPVFVSILAKNSGGSGPASGILEFSISNIHCVGR